MKDKYIAFDDDRDIGLSDSPEHTKTIGFTGSQEDASITGFTFEPEKPFPESVHKKILEWRAQNESKPASDQILPADTSTFDDRSKQADKKTPVGKNPVTIKALLLTAVFAVILSTLLGAMLGSRWVLKNAEDAEKNRKYENLSSSTLENTTNSNMSIEQIVERNADAVVEINTSVETQTLFGVQAGQGAGSGVIIKDNGYIVTNYHVISGAKNVTVILRDGKEYNAQIVGYDDGNDIAVLKIAAEGLTTATVGNSEDLKVGDMTVAIGNPLGQLGGTATSGIISALDRQISLDEGITLSLLQTDSAINPGNSGGGLFSDNGDLIGIVVAKSSGTGIEGLGFAIPINTAAPIIDDIIKNGTVTEKPAAGITIFNVTEDRVEYYDVDEPGVYIADVNGNNAKEAGLKTGDRIIGFEGQAVESSSALVAEIQKHKIGDEVTFKISRNGKELDISLKLEDSSKFTSN